MSDESVTTTKHSTIGRRVFLIGVMIVELLAVYSLRFLGWNETGHWIQWLLAIAVVLFPLAAALLILFFRGRSFSLRAMMIATTLLAIFVSLVMYPYTQVRQRRRATAIMESKGIQYDTRTALQRAYEFANLEYRQEPEASTRNTDDIPRWMKPLLSDSLPTYPDRAVRVVALNSDQEIKVVADLLPSFPNLEEVRINSIYLSDDALQYAAEHFPKLESLQLIHTTIPDDWGPSLKGLRRLGVIGNISAFVRTPLTDQQIKNILAINGLESLFFDSIDINDKNAALLGELPTLKHLTLWRTNITEVGRQAIMQRHPKLIMRIGPNMFTPVHFIGVFAGKPKSTFRMTFNQPPTQWGRQVSQDGRGMKYFGDRSASIDKNHPLTIEIADPTQQDATFIIVTLHKLRRYANRYGMVEAACQQSEFAATITFVNPAAPK